MPSLSSRSVFGFTLLEMVVTVAIIAVLATIALPTYFGKIRKGSRADAMTTLINVQLKQEIWRATHSTYASSPASIGLSTTTPEGLYTLNITGASATTYMLNATAMAGTDQAQDQENGTPCTPMSIDQNGAKTPAVCWR